MEKIQNESQLMKLFVKYKTYKVPREPKEGQEQVELTFRPISLDKPELFKHLNKVSKDSSIDELIIAMRPIIAYSLDCPEEHIEKINIEILHELFEIISEMNNFEKVEKKVDVTKFIKDKQELLSNKELTKSISNV